MKTKSRKKWLGVLITLAMVAGLLPISVSAATTIATLNLKVAKEVVQGDAAVPPPETFEFELADADFVESPQSPEEAGITFGELKVTTTAGAGVYEYDIPVEVDTSKATEENGWLKLTMGGSGELIYYYRTFIITEKNDGKADWTYSTKRHALTFCCYPDGKIRLEIHEPNNDVYYDKVEFKNTYTARDISITIPVKKIVALGGNQAPGSTNFNFDIAPYGNPAADLSGLKITGNTITTNGKGEYEGAITIRGDVDQITNARGLILTEKNDNAADWKYDDTTYIVQLYNGNEVVIQKDMGEDMNPMNVDIAEFTNTYTKNVTPTVVSTPTATPNTGDTGNWILWGAVLLIACGGVVTLGVARKKNEHSR